MDSVRNYAQAVVKSVRSAVAADSGSNSPTNKTISTMKAPSTVIAHRKSSQRIPPSNNNEGNCIHDLTKAVSLLALCVGLIVKGVAYDNSHWANQDEIDVVNNKDQFPIMTSFIDNMKSGKHENCEDAKCRIFFDKYSALQTLSAARGGSSGPVPLRGRASRGVNRRCEQISLAPSGDAPLGSGSTSKYEKCTIDKQSEVNEFKTIRYLLIASMICDALGLLNWVAILSYSGHPSRSGLARLFLVTSSLCGFIAALLTGLALGLFAQAVDIFEDARLYLGWPFYAVCASAFLSMVTAVTSASRLQKAAHNYENSGKATVLSPTVSVIDIGSEEYEAYPIGCLPPTYRFGYVTQAQTPQKQHNKSSNKALTPAMNLCEDDTADCQNDSSPDRSQNNGNEPFRYNAFINGNSARRSDNNNTNNNNNNDSAFRRV